MSLSDDFNWLLRCQDDVVSWRQACAHLHEEVVRRRVNGGRWQRPCHGVIVAHNGPLTAEQREWAALLTAGPGAVLAGTTAARRGGLRGYDSDSIHVLVPATRRVNRRAYRGLPVASHRSSTLLPVEKVGRPPRTHIARSLVDAAQWAHSDNAARAIVAAGFQQRLVRLDEISATVHRLPRARRRRLVLQTAIDASGGAHSVAEADLARLCRRHRLPTPTHQQPRRDSQGRHRWLDAYWQEWRLHVEVDGAHHMEVREWWADMQRQNALWVAGERVLRFPNWALRHRPDDVAGQIRAALMAAGWQPVRPRRHAPSR
jgi:very-short-patch-repair endonuclease